MFIKLEMATKIKTLRTLKGYTQEELGDLLGVKKSAIQKYENGSIINLKVDTINQLCKIFNVSPNYLLNYEDEETININIDCLRIYNLLDELNNIGLDKVEDYLEDLILLDKYRKDTEELIEVDGISFESVTRY